MTDERNNVHREYKDRLFKRIPLPFSQFVVFYNGTQNEPECQTLHLHDAFPEQIREKFGVDVAALDCHAVVLNINYGYNRELMAKCRKLEEYSILINRIRKYQKQGLPLREAIGRAVDDCIRDGILERLLRENREDGRLDDLKRVGDKEVRANLYKEYNITDAGF